MDTPGKSLLAIDWASPELPTFPAIAHLLVTMMGEENGNATELAKLIGQDPTLTLKILQAVNSAFYSLRMEVTSVRHAIVMLGLDEVRRIALSSIMAERVMSVPADLYNHARDLWRHFLATAIIASDLATEGDEEPDLYTLGLLHDIGWLVLLAQAPKVYKSVCEEASRTRLEAEKAWGLDHQLWGAKLAEHWELPEPFQVAAYRHHNPLAEINPPRYLLRIALANHLAHAAGFTILNAPPEPIEKRTLKWLAIDEATLAEMEEGAQADHERIAGLCDLLT